MSVTLRELLEEADLGLRCTATDERLDREIRWVHVSEVADPTPWLSGGELLITTGLQLSTTRSMREYVQRLADRNIAGIGFGTGGTVHAPYATIPAALHEEAERRRLPIIEVPIEVPYLAVSEFVTKRLVSDQFALVQRAYDIQRQLTSAALEPRGRAEVLRLVSAATASDVAVVSLQGLVLDSSADFDPDSLAPLRADLERARAHNSVAQITGEDGSVQAIHPIGSRRRTRQLLVVRSSHTPVPLDRMVISGAVAVLSVDAERRLGFSPERQIASDRLGALAFRAGASTRDRTDALVALGFAPHATVTVAGMNIPGAVGPALAEDVNDVLFDRGVPSAFVTNTPSEAPFMLIAALSPTELSDVITEIFRELTRRGGQAGVSGPHRIGDLMIAAQESAAALRHAEQARIPLQRYQDMLLHSVVLDAIPELRRTAIADVILSRLEEEPAHLGAALNAFLQHNGNLTQAAHALEVHRQTLMKRLAEAERCLGVSLDSPDDRSALWVALSARSMPR